MRLRDPHSADTIDLAELMTELGYPATASEVPERLEMMARDPNVLVTVAEHDGRVVGIVTAHVLRAVHKSDPVAWLTALVVLDQARGMGIGKRLVAHAEDWARARGAGTISLTSALRRSEAHEFYKRIGYEHTGLRLTKALV